MKILFIGKHTSEPQTCFFQNIAHSTCNLDQEWCSDFEHYLWTSYGKLTFLLLRETSSERASANWCKNSTNAVCWKVQLAARASFMKEIFFPQYLTLIECVFILYKFLNLDVMSYCSYYSISILEGHLKLPCNFFFPKTHGIPTTSYLVAQPV